MKIGKNLIYHLKAAKKRPLTYWNLLKYFFYHNSHLIRVPHYPSWLEIEISTKCNLNCPRCERKVAPKKLLGRNTSIETIKKISPIFPYVRDVSLVSGLGEPFLNPDFWEIIKIIKNSGPAVAYTTNGFFLTEENIEKTIINKVDVVVVSLDSLKGEIYGKIRGGASLNEVVRNLEKLIKERKDRNISRPEIRIGFAFQKSTIEEIPNMVEFAHQLGVDTVYCTALIANREDIVEESTYFLDSIYVSQIFQKAKEKALKLGVKIRLPEIIINNLNQLCCYPWQAMFISYNGDVSCSSYFRYPKRQFFCVEEEKIINKPRTVAGVFLGNINQESILKIWNNISYKRLRNNMKLGLPQSPCNECYFRYGLH